jgi:hypothetical protein
MTETADRVSFTENGTLDEIVASRGAHLERVGKSEWFLTFGHGDGSETALWFTSKDLVRPNLEKRAP